jgi:hypothetical protein
MFEDSVYFMGNLYVISCFFNSCGYKKPLANYFHFRELLKRQGVKLIVIECEFGDDGYYLPEEEGVYRLRGGSLMWMRERLLNYGMSKLPDDCDYVAFLDTDIVFSDCNWGDMLVDKLSSSDVVQLYERMYHWCDGVSDFGGDYLETHEGVVSQWKNNENWHWKRKKGELSWAHTGFGWGFKRSFLEGVGGVYDKCVIGGSGDTIMTDCLLDSFYIHYFVHRYNKKMISDIMVWCDRVRGMNPVIDYLPISVGHLYHGSLSDRNYVKKHSGYFGSDFDPLVDIKLVDGLYEWSSEKLDLHDFVRSSFKARREDS